MPDSPTIRIGGTGGAFCELQASRTATGVCERTVGGVPVGGGTDVLALAVGIGEALATEHNVGFASLAVADYDLDGGELVVPARVRTRKVPLVLVLGPVALRDLGVDTDLVVRGHDARLLGRAKTPTLLVAFDEPDPERRLAQVVQFHVDAGVAGAFRDAAGGV